MALIRREELGSVARYEMGTLACGLAPAPGAPTPGEARAHDAGEAREAAAREAGYAAGLAEGRAAAARMEALAGCLAQAVARFEADTAGEITDLALAIARQVLRANVETRRAALAGVVREALAQLPEELRSPKLVVHPGDLAIVRSQLGDILERGNWTLVQDHRIEPGGCRIVGAESGVDATLGTRWKRVVAALGRDLDWNDA